MKSRYFLVIVASISFSLVIPLLYSLVFSKPLEKRIIFYSKVIEDIVYSVEDRSGQRRYFDGSGNEYDAKEYAKLIPFIMYRDLYKWGLYPDMVGGEPISIDRASMDKDVVTIYPRWIDAEKVRIKLYPLFESESDFMKLDLPSELFRITSRMEFVNGVKNRVDEEKSRRFTEALEKEGFKFPPRMIAGNPTIRKPYDFGYFILDAEDTVFHLLQAKGRPVVKKTDIRPEGKILYITVKEDPNLPYYGTLVTEGGGVFHIMKDTYEIRRLSVTFYDPMKQSFKYMKDPLNMTVKISDEFSEEIYVLNNRYEMEKTFSFPLERKIRGVFRSIYDTVFPFSISMKHPYKYAETHLYFRLSEKLPTALAFSTALAVAYAVFRIFRGGRGPYVLMDAGLVAVGGVYAALALLVLDGRRRNKA